MATQTVRFSAEPGQTITVKAISSTGSTVLQTVAASAVIANSVLYQAVFTDLPADEYVFTLTASGQEFGAFTAVIKAATGVYYPGSLADNPWPEQLPGSYANGSAGKILGNLPAQIAAGGSFAGPLGPTGATSTGFCTVNDVAYWMSASGIAEFSSDQWPNALVDEGAMAFCIQNAEQQIQMHVAPRYDDAGLRGNPWIKHTAAFLSACVLSIRLGRPLPEAWVSERDRIYDQLKDIQQGRAVVPNAPMSFLDTPTMTNLRVDNRYHTAKVRAEEVISVGGKGDRPRYTDPDSYLVIW